MIDESFMPATSREALLEIRRVIAAQHEDFKPTTDDLISIDRAAMLGLDSRNVTNFELTDILADRLAEAHKLLRQLHEHQGEQPWATLQSEIGEALALPPDLEAMVERRIGHG